MTPAHSDPPVRGAWTRSAAWCVLLILGAGCAGTRPNVHRYLLGRPPGYESVPVVPPDAETASTASVLRPEAQALASRRPPPVVATLEATDPALASALARLQAEPSATHHLQVALEYRRCGVDDLAHLHLTRVLELDPANARAYDARARVSRDWGFPDRALPDAHRAVYFAPWSPAARNTLGTVLYRLGKGREARRQFDAALSLDPRAGYALVNRCSLDVSENRGQDAVLSCRAALELEPGSAVARANLARALALLGASMVTSNARAR